MGGRGQDQPWALPAGVSHTEGQQQQDWDSATSATSVPLGITVSATSTGGEDKGKWPRKGWDVGKQGQAKGTHILDLRKNVLALGLNRVSTPPSGRDGAGFTALTEQTSVEGTGPDLTGSWDWLFFSCA